MKGLPGNDRWCQESSGQGGLGRTDGTGGQLGQDSRDRADWSGQDILGRTSGTEQLGQDSRAGRTGQISLIGNLDRTARAWKCLESVCIYSQ
jgi:hypothetical protein